MVSLLGFSPNPDLHGTHSPLGPDVFWRSLPCVGGVYFQATVQFSLLHSVNGLRSRGTDSDAAGPRGSCILPLQTGRPDVPIGSCSCLLTFSPSILNVLAIFRFAFRGFHGLSLRSGAIEFGLTAACEPALEGGKSQVLPCFGGKKQVL